MIRNAQDFMWRASRDAIWDAILGATWGDTQDAIWLAMRSNARRDIEHATVDAGMEFTVGADEQGAEVE